MISLNPEFLTKHGKKEFVVLPYEEFEALRDYLDTLEDLLDLRKAKQEEAECPTISLDEAKQQLDLS
ncbi:MAG: type II toxin-antitoxin system Phd/YefM family antitoxin [Cyanothece sp. SIO2G6]|nr:type II toxin-antitoxin system Phd/YefM family antitoxin [Cyanothece sp. SIO2G6]